MQVFSVNRPKRRKKRSRQEKSSRRKSAKAFYRSKEWRELRYKALIAHNGCCMACGRSASEGAVLHVDHVMPRSKYPQLALDIHNLQVLCSRCNLGKGAWDTTDWREAADSHMAEICDPRFIGPS